LNQLDIFPGDRFDIKSKMPELEQRFFRSTGAIRQFLLMGIPIILMWRLTICFQSENTKSF